MNELITKVLAWAEDRNILEGSTPKDQFIKAMSEFGELADALAKNNKADLGLVLDKMREALEKPALVESDFKRSNSDYL